MKGGAASFGSIVAVIGAILIGVGIAWNLASNWHYLPAIAKILILLLFTAGAYTGGVILRAKNYLGTGKALLLLGSLIYTLSVFLIAQIFSTSASLQGTAHLLLLSWVGVLVASYLLDSTGGLFIGLIEFLIWITCQYFAFIRSADYELFLGPLTLIYLTLALVFYGAYLLHQTQKHAFAQLYKIWSAFYFLLFAYLLSFQSLLPFLWLTSFSITSSTGVLLGIFTVLALILFVFGLHIARPPIKESISFGVLILLFLILIAATAFVSGTIGTCQTKTCYQYNDPSLCEQSPGGYSRYGCEWRENTCTERTCYHYLNQTTCETPHEKLTCKWNQDYCVEEDCYLYRTQESCEKSLSDCRWEDAEPIQEKRAGPPSQHVQLPEQNFCVKKENQPLETDTSCALHSDSTTCSQQSHCSWRVDVFAAREKTTGKSWAVWIFANILFLALILAIIGWGSWLKSSKLINLGILFFVLDIITRYIGFIMDFWGYTSLSLIFITGGVLLLGGGWLVQKWRKKLLQTTQKDSS